MPAGPVGSVWASGSWSATAWTANTWADAVPPAPPVPQVLPARFRYTRRNVPQDPLQAFLNTELQNIQRAMPVIAIRAVSASTTATATDGVILCDPTAAAIVVTLPDPIRAQFMVVTVKQITSAAHAVTVTPQSGTIDGASSATVGGINKAITVQSNGAAWFIIGQV